MRRAGCSTNKRQLRFDVELHFHDISPVLLMVIDLPGALTCVLGLNEAGMLPKRKSASAGSKSSADGSMFLFLPKEKSARNCKKICGNKKIVKRQITHPFCLRQKKAPWKGQ
jgi:hypothetical protein